ncbi:hypothetical protein GCM10027258_47970 [Amycolatopsis stemonae]
MTGVSAPPNFSHFVAGTLEALERLSNPWHLLRRNPDPAAIEQCLAAACDLDYSAQWRRK